MLLRLFLLSLDLGEYSCLYRVYTQPKDLAWEEDIHVQSVYHVSLVGRIWIYPFSRGDLLNYILAQYTTLLVGLGL